MSESVPWTGTSSQGSLAVPLCDDSIGDIETRLAGNAVHSSAFVTKASCGKLQGLLNL